MGYLEDQIEEAQLRPQAHKLCLLEAFLLGFGCCSAPFLKGSHISADGLARLLSELVDAVCPNFVYLERRCFLVSFNA